jgi:hypothetical protein
LQEVEHLPCKPFGRIGRSNFLPDHPKSSFCYNSVDRLSRLSGYPLAAGGF